MEYTGKTPKDALNELNKPYTSHDYDPCGHPTHDVREVIKAGLEGELKDLEAGINKLLGITLLEHEDKNLLAGDNKSRAEMQLHILEDLRDRIKLLKIQGYY